MSCSKWFDDCKNRCWSAKYRGNIVWHSLTLKGVLNTCACCLIRWPRKKAHLHICFHLCASQSSFKFMAIECITDLDKITLFIWTQVIFLLMNQKVAQHCIKGVKNNQLATYSKVMSKSLIHSLVKTENYSWVTFDHFWSENYCLRLLGYWRKLNQT